MLLSGRRTGKLCLEIAEENILSFTFMKVDVQELSIRDFHFFFLFEGDKVGFHYAFLCDSDISIA